MLKRIVNLMISMFVGIGDSLQGIFGGGQPRCVVLAYHAVSPEERPKFAQQMDVLLRKASPVPADIASLPAQAKLYAAITFDDGLENVIENALPELQKRSIPSTLFIVTETLGGKRAWEHRGGEDTRGEQVMSVEQLRQLPSDLVTIGSHTMTHAFLPSAGAEKLRQEIAGSRSKLESLVGRQVKLLSFPYGAFNDTVIAECHSANYERVFTALPAFAFSTPGQFVSGRVGAAPTDWPIEFRLKLTGAYRWQPFAFSLKRRIKSALRGNKGAAGKLKEEKRVA